MYKNHGSQQKGFTLIELMLVTMVVAVLAAIAMPSYRYAMVRNAESEAQAKVKQIKLDLESWRSKTLSFQGFAPKKVVNGAVKYEYDADDKVVYLPVNSNASTARYKITITNANGDSLKPNQKDLNKITSGNSWKIFAEPMNSFENEANKYLATSNGLQCKGKGSAITSSATDCSGAGVSSW